MSTERAIRDVFVSPNECDSNFEPANVVDGLFAIARAINRLASAVQQVGSIVPPPVVSEDVLVPVPFSEFAKERDNNGK